MKVRVKVLVSLRSGQRLLLTLLIFSIPSSLGYHFFRDQAFVFGYQINYLIPALCLSDIFIGLFFFLLFLELLKYPPERRALKVFVKHCPEILWLGVFVLFTIPNLDVGVPIASWYLWLKLLESFLLAVFLAWRFPLSENLGFYTFSFSLPIVFQALVALLQFIEQKSLWGYFFLGETTYNLLTPGVAKTQFLGRVFLRAYGTTLHPNVLGGFFALGLLVVWFGYLSLERQKPVYGFVLGLGLLGLVLTFSRTALLALGVASFISLVGRRRERFSFAQGWLLLILFLGLLAFVQAPFWRSPSFMDRYALALASLRVWRDNFWFGVGLNNFVATLALGEYGFFPVRLLQPGHNIFLLLLAEGGVLAFLAFLGVLYASFFLGRKLRETPEVNSLLSFVLVVGFFDHYLLTLQTGRLLFSFALALAMGLKPRAWRGRGNE